VNRTIVLGRAGVKAVAVKIQPGTRSPAERVARSRVGRNGRIEVDEID